MIEWEALLPEFGSVQGGRGWSKRVHFFALNYIKVSIDWVINASRPKLQQHLQQKLFQRFLKIMKVVMKVQLSYYSTFTPMYHPVKQKRAANCPKWNWSYHTENTKGLPVHGVAAWGTKKYNAEISQSGDVSEPAVSAAQQICCW